MNALPKGASALTCFLSRVILTVIFFLYAILYPKYTHSKNIFLFQCLDFYAKVCALLFMQVGKIIVFVYIFSKERMKEASQTFNKKPFNFLSHDFQ